MGLDSFTSGETAALQIVADLQNTNQLLTNTNLQSQLLALNASWVAPYVVSEITLDASGNLNIARSAKVHYIIVNTFASAGEDTLSAIVESNTWNDGDAIYLIPKLYKNVIVSLPTVAMEIRMQGDYVKLVRVYGVWSFEASYPRYAADSRNTVEEHILLSSLTEFFSQTTVSVINAVSGGTGAMAVYEVTAVTGAGNVINLYVDGILIAVGTDGSSIDNMGTDLETYINGNLDFTAVYNSGTNELTITDARGLGTIANAFLLSSEELNGAAGQINSQFTGGINGAEASITIDTIGGLTAGKTLEVHNGMAAQTVTLTDVGGNLSGAACPLVIAAGEWATVSCIVSGSGRVKA